MENLSIHQAHKLFLLLHPRKAHLIDISKSSVSTLGYVRLRSKDDRVLLAIKQDDIETQLLEAQSKSEAKDKRKRKNEEINEICQSIVLNIISGPIDDELCLAVHQANSEIQIQYRSRNEKPRSGENGWEGHWGMVNSALKHWEIVKRDKVSNIVVEEIRSNEKKDVVGAAAAGIAMGFLTGGAGLLAGATSGNYQDVLFKFTSPILGEFICETKHDIYKHILGSCKSYS